MNEFQALTPSAHILPSFASEEEVLDPTEITDEIKAERELAGLTEHPGWSHFVALIQDQIIDLRIMRIADLEGLSHEQVGQKFLVASLAADKLEQAIAIVEQSAEQVDTQMALESDDGEE
jgi:hypothetical protein